jgi:hypothetical protein
MILLPKQGDRKTLQNVTNHLAPSLMASSCDRLPIEEHPRKCDLSIAYSRPQEFIFVDQIRQNRGILLMAKCSHAFSQSHKVSSFPFTGMGDKIPVQNFTVLVSCP